MWGGGGVRLKKKRGGGGGSGDQGVTTPQNTEYQGFMILGLYRPIGRPRTIGMRGMRHLPIQGEDMPYLIFENNYVLLSKCRRHLYIYINKSNELNRWSFLSIFLGNEWLLTRITRLLPSLVIYK